MDQHDKFYTPDHLADRLIGHIAEEDIETAVDFCVGDGDLLKAVQRRFPDVKCFGVDISEESIECLRKEHTNWTLGACDFMERAKVTKLKGFEGGKYDLIVLNPPFTCKGSTLCKIEFDGKAFKCSTALMFLTEALGYLNKKGVLYAILPIGCLCTQKDRELWNYLVENYQLKVLEKQDRPYWWKCSPNILLVSLKSELVKPTNNNVVEFDFTHLPIKEIIRGSIGMHEVKYSEGSDGQKVIHTTNMQENLVKDPRRIRNGKQYSMNGTVVLVPRVCNPNKGKICIYSSKSPFVLSDCVVALKTENEKDAQTVYEALMNHWEDFREVYNGTGAKYTTMERLNELFGMN